MTRRTRKSPARFILAVRAGARRIRKSCADAGF